MPGNYSLRDGQSQSLAAQRFACMQLLKWHKELA
jgi:hypothetical protein